jgi:hypothetical protein
MTEYNGSILRKPRFDANGIMIALDKLGQEIKVGDYIAYGHALGRCAGLRIGKVLNIKYEESNDWSNSKIFKIKVWGIDDEWSYDPILCSTPGTLNFPDRIVVLPIHQIPPDYVELLKDITNNSKIKDVRKTIPEYKDRIRRN